MSAISILNTNVFVTKYLYMSAITCNISLKIEHIFLLKKTYHYWLWVSCFLFSCWLSFWSAVRHGPPIWFLQESVIFSLCCNCYKTQTKIYCQYDTYSQVYGKRGIKTNKSMSPTIRLIHLCLLEQGKQIQYPIINRTKYCTE